MIQTIKDLVSAKADTTVALAREIWGYAELSYEETKSAAALIAALKQEGFTIEEGIADIPTAFTATFTSGSGKPVVGFLAEYDALSGLSQKAGCPVQEAVQEGGAGHGCGHNLLGAGCYAAAVALKDYLIKEKKDGTVIFFGCPAEEGAGSKQFIARAGYFDNVDFAYTWHPETVNEVGSRGSVAIMGANFTFDGIAAHAGGEPHLGRSALDAVELMNVGCNYLREHMIDAARIHYAYSDPGGTAPNVVQSHAVIKYEVRAPKVSQVQELFTRVVDVARGAALMTGTKMKYEITMAFSDYVPNRTLGAVVDQCMRELGAPEWTEPDYRLAAEFLRTIPAPPWWASGKSLATTSSRKSWTPPWKSPWIGSSIPSTPRRPPTVPAPPTWATWATPPPPSCSTWPPPAWAMWATPGRTPPLPAPISV